MEQTARARGACVRRAAAPVLPEDLIVWEILVRVPPKTLLRCRVVCRSWRRRTTGADFLLAHHRCQPSLPLLRFSRPNPRRRPDVVVDAVNIWRPPVERRPLLPFKVNDCSHRHSHMVHASCDGLLVVSVRSGLFYYICNPTTREWIRLPNLNFSYSIALVLYPHSSSGEYRILYWNLAENDTRCYVFTVGSSMAPRDVGKYRESGLQFVTQGRSVLLHGCLHWVHSKGEKVLVFDTDGESFRWMSGPTYDDDWTMSDLVEINSTLGISRIEGTQYTKSNSRLLKSVVFFFFLISAEISSVANSSHFLGMLLSDNGEVLVYGNRSSDMFRCDSTGKLLQKVQWDDVVPPWPTRKWFKESLVRHAFFQWKDGHKGGKTRFFEGF